MKIKKEATSGVDAVYRPTGNGLVVALDGGILEHQKIMVHQDVVPAAFVHSLAICSALGGIFWTAIVQLYL